MEIIMGTWFKNNLDIVFFIYGLVFFVMGVAIFVQPKKQSAFKLAKVFWLLGVFGIIHGINEWLDMWAIIKGDNQLFSIIRFFTLAVSFIYLFEFGRRVFCLPETNFPLQVKKIVRKITWGVPAVTVLALSFIICRCSGICPLKNIFARYFICLPANILAGLGLLSYYKYDKPMLQYLKTGKYFLTAAVSFFAYAVFGGLIVQKGNFLLSNIINEELFLADIKIPVQLFRGLCAVVMMWAVLGMLNIFNMEYVDKLHREINRRKRAEEELDNIFKELKKQG